MASADCRRWSIWERDVGVGLVDEGVELLHGFPDGHLGAGLAVEVVAGPQVVGYGLLLVLLAVEVLDTVACLFVLAELCLVLLCIELGLCVDVLLFLCGGALLDLHGSLEDVDIVDHVRCSFESKTITVVIEVLRHVGLLEDGAWCHCDGYVCSWVVKRALSLYVSSDNGES